MLLTEKFKLAVIQFKTLEKNIFCMFPANYNLEPLRLII